jgi:hypothetical protein
MSVLRERDTKLRDSDRLYELIKKNRETIEKLVNRIIEDLKGRLDFSGDYSKMYKDTILKDFNKEFEKWNRHKTEENYNNLFEYIQKVIETKLKELKDIEKVVQYYYDDIRIIISGKRKTHRKKQYRLKIKKVSKSKKHKNS